MLPLSRLSGAGQNPSRPSVTRRATASVERTSHEDSLSRACPRASEIAATGSMGRWRRRDDWARRGAE